jgi:hypothetical protein
MIHFFARHLDLIEEFMDSWAPELRPHIRRIHHNRIPFFRSLARGAYIFSDFERLPSWKRSWVESLNRRLRAEGGGHTVLNDPVRYVSRFRLLRLLHEQQMNRYQVWRIGDREQELKFPLFLRSEVDHRGSITGLLHSPDEISRALSRLSLRDRLRKKHLMLIEFCDGADARGVFRKYSAMNVNGTLVPRHILFSKDWVTKNPDLVSDATVAEENEFVATFPHRERLAEIFRMAGVDYGRVDYGVKDGRIQVWEINTNPIIVPRRVKVDPRRMASQSESARRITEALMALAG